VSIIPLTIQSITVTYIIKEQTDFKEVALCCYQEGPHRAIALQTQRKASPGCGLIGAFAELQKLTISFVMSVRPSAWKKKKLCSHWTDFHLNLVFSYFSKICPEN